MERFLQRRENADKRKQKTTTEAPIEVIADILSRLPVKTILRFKSVSKPWYNVISEPSFVNLHRQKSRRKLNVLYITCNEPCTTLTFTSADCEWNISEVVNKNIASCGGIGWVRCASSSYNDLICLMTSFLHSFEHINHICEHIYLYNPVSHEVFALPERKIFLDYTYDTFGFGYVSSTREYKVLRLFANYEWEIKCEIFTFCPRSDGSNPCCSWREISQKSSCRVRFCKEPVFVRECFHWLTWGNSYPSRKGEVIISFDLRTEKFNMIPLPSEFNNCPIPQNSLILVVDDFEGKLSLVKYQSPVLLSLWVLEDYDKHIWNRTYDIDFGPILYPLQHCYICRHMANGELLILCPDPGTNFYSHYFYNTKSHSLRRVSVPMKQTSEYNQRFGFYWESMVTL